MSPPAFRAAPCGRLPPSVTVTLIGAPDSLSVEKRAEAVWSRRSAASWHPWEKKADITQDGGAVPRLPGADPGGADRDGEQHDSPWAGEPPAAAALRSAGWIPLAPDRGCSTLCAPLPQKFLESGLTPGVMGCAERWLCLPHGRTGMVHPRRCARCHRRAWSVLAGEVSAEAARAASRRLKPLQFGWPYRS